jgi:MFS transporter, ACS family, aldohexuronate transporter
MRARKTAMLVCALAVTPMIFTARISNLWAAVAMISLATAAHQAWAANVFTLVSDLYPRPAVASVVGICGFFGSVGGMLFAASTGLVLQWTHSYQPMFVLAGSAYLMGLGIIHLGMGKELSWNT